MYKSQPPIYKIFIFLTIFILGLSLLVVTAMSDKTIFAQNREEDGNHRISCRTPANPEVLDWCQVLEEEMLCSTVRLQIDYWLVKPDESGYLIENSIGHGTVKNGRYLVTHNHFSEPFSNNPEVESQNIYTRIHIFNTAGTMLTGVSADDVSIVAQEPQMLILDFGEHNGSGFFENLGMASATFNEGQMLSLEAGIEVAQIDWDGLTTRVDWTTIQEIKYDIDVKYLEISDPLLIGASGGGVFFQGIHIGNNWKTTSAGGYSTAAFDPRLINEHLTDKGSTVTCQNFPECRQFLHFP